MQQRVLTQRLAGGRVAFGNGQQRRVHRQHVRNIFPVVSVAAVEETQTLSEMNDSELKAMYKKFDRLIRTHTPNFQPGDKVKFLRDFHFTFFWFRQSPGTVPTSTSSRWNGLRLEHAPRFFVQIEGTVFKVDVKGAYVDVGGKSAAFCPTAELSLAPINRVSGLPSLTAGHGRSGLLHIHPCELFLPLELS